MFSNNYVLKITDLINNFQLNVVVANIYSIYTLFNSSLTEKISNECLKKNFTRGDHAHHKCKQFLIPIFGKMEVEYENRFKKFKKVINYKDKKGLLLNPKTWCKIKFKTNNSILMVFCDREYEFKDYIENYKNFLKIVKK